MRPATDSKIMKEIQPSAANRSIVAVVVDDPAVRNPLKFSLELEGFAVRAYAAGADLLGATDLAGYACLIVDQNMPGMSGLDVVAALRDRHVSVPAMLITSQPNVGVRSRAARAGISIVEKPFLGDALIESIQRAVAPPG